MDFAPLRSQGVSKATFSCACISFRLRPDTMEAGDRRIARTAKTFSRAAVHLLCPSVRPVVVMVRMVTHALNSRRDVQTHALSGWCLLSQDLHSPMGERAVTGHSTSA
jgi:hypothetical protein